MIRKRLSQHIYGQSLLFLLCSICECISRCQLHQKCIIILAFAPTPVTLMVDGRQFSFRISRRCKLYNKFPILFSDYPIVHTRDLATNKSKAGAEGPTIVLTIEKLTAELQQGSN